MAQPTSNVAASLLTRSRAMGMNLRAVERGAGAFEV